MDIIIAYNTLHKYKISLYKFAEFTKNGYNFEFTHRWDILSLKYALS